MEKGTKTNECIASKKPEGEIRRELNLMNGSLEELDKTVGALYDILEPVLSSAEPVNNPSEVEEEISSELASTIYEKRRKLQIYIMSIRRIIERVQL